MAHIHDKIDFTVATFIVNNKRVLLILHKKLKKWLPVGGHIELDETPDQALFREIQEESGIFPESLTVLSTKPDITSEGTTFLYTPNYVDIHTISDTHQHIGMVYFLKSNTDQIIQAEAEHDGIRWVSESELDDSKLNLSEAVKFYAKQAIAKSDLF